MFSCCATGNFRDRALSAVHSDFPSRNRVIAESVSWWRTSYLYDHDGNLNQVTDRNGLITQYQTDVVNRTTTETWLDTDDTTVIRSIISTYDADGRLISVTDHDGSDDPIAADYTYDYDDTARTLTTTTEIANMSVPVVFTETFNGNNERTQLAASIDGTNDFVNNYHYDHLGREDQVIQEGNGGNSVPTKRVDFGYNLDSQFDHIDRYNSSTASAANLVATSTYGYDEANRLTSLTYVNDTTTYAGFGYDYNADNLLITSTNSADTSENVTFTYDNSGQLLTADRPAPASMRITRTMPPAIGWLRPWKHLAVVYDLSE